MTSWGKTDPRDVGCAHSESGGWTSLFLNMLLYRKHASDRDGL